MKKRTIKIYTLAHPVTGEIRYIGKTHFGLNERLAKHLITYERNHRANWIRNIVNQGMKPIIELLEVIDNENWISAEIYWIEQFRNWGFRLLNATEGGESGVISQQCRIAQKQMLKTAKAKSQVKNIHKFSVEKTSKKVLQLDKQGNLIQEFNSASEAARQIKGHLSHITECCNNKPKRLTHKGYKWKYKVEDIV
jgi:hypothetical protein